MTMETTVLFLIKEQPTFVTLAHLGTVHIFKPSLNGAQ